MRAVPDDIDLVALTRALAAGWGFDAETVAYAALGAGSYHWVATDGAGARRFVTVDDLDRKTWLGDTRDVAFDGLRRAFETAAALRTADLAFVVAPLTSLGGETLQRFDTRYTVALFPFVAGHAGEFGRYEPGARSAVSILLAGLHQAPSAAASAARSFGVELPGRRHIEAGLHDLSTPWSGGPLSEPAREALSDRAGDVVRLLSLTDRLAADLEQRGAPWVVTHGEPHAGNAMRTTDGYVLVDWDTVGVAPRERDLWMLVDEAADALTEYTDATGCRVDQNALDFFRLTWDLKDLAEWLNALRSPHDENEDTLAAYSGVKTYTA